MYKISEELRRYYYLIKPGIVYNNTMTAIAGVCLAASQFGWDWIAGVYAVIGTALIIASACVFNNVLDRKIDSKMKRTQKRPTVTGTVSAFSANTYATFLGVLGFAALVLGTNWLTVVVGIVAYVWYIAIYGWAKRHTSFSTLIGTVPGALPPVAGYVALSGTIDLNAWLVFVMLAVWQMGHFYAIAIFRRDEYALAKLPIISVQWGFKATIRQMIIYIAAFIWASIILTISGATGYIYAVVMVAAGAWWLLVSLPMVNKKGKALYSAARKSFGVSIVVNLVMCLAIATGGFLP